MQVGGNKAFKEFLQEYRINNDDQKYWTKAAEYYRNLLTANSVLNLLAKPTRDEGI